MEELPKKLFLKKNEGNPLEGISEGTYSRVTPRETAPGRIPEGMPIIELSEGKSPGEISEQILLEKSLRDLLQKVSLKEHFLENSFKKLLLLQEIVLSRKVLNKLFRKEFLNEILRNNP